MTEKSSQDCATEACEHSSGSHTPGPWHWDSDPVKNDPLGRVRYRVTTTGKTIAQVYYSSYEGGLTNAAISKATGSDVHLGSSR